MAAVVFFAAVVFLAVVAFLAAVLAGAAVAVLCRPLALPVLGNLRGSATTVLNEVPGLNFGTVVLRIRTA